VIAAIDIGLAAGFRFFDMAKPCVTGAKMDRPVRLESGGATSQFAALHHCGEYRHQAAQVNGKDVAPQNKFSG
jgi:hypothetical protein